MTDITRMNVMRTYRVYFIDGNQKLYQAENIYSCIAYIAFCDEMQYHSGDIAKVELVDG